ncbi:MAG: hypothetical protein FJZ87_00585 [Chloroflexi bacterium]|nr:hypothetical protein [Chloroflexota bacterium]
MKKTVLVVALIVLALGIVGVGVAFAQDETPPFQGYRHGFMHEGMGPLHTFMTVEFARELNLNVNDVNTRLSQGENMYDIALSAGVTAEEFPNVMQKIRSKALDAAAKANVITKEQADWMKSRGFGGGGMGYGSCGGYGLQNGRGPGMMNGGWGRWQGQPSQ